MRVDRVARRLFAGVLLCLFLQFCGGGLRAQEPEEEKLDVANVFTPNGDGKNDTFELNSSEDLFLHVFNRNGVLVYQAKGRRIVWDGNNQRGQKLEDGVYFFTLEDPAGTYNQNHGFLYISRSANVNPPKPWKSDVQVY